MNSQQFQFQGYSAAEFEEFRQSVQTDGFAVTSNTIDSISGHIGALTYLTGNYNRNQQLLTVTVKTSPWQSFRDEDLKSNITRIVKRDQTSTEEGKHPVNQTAMKTPTTQVGTGLTPANKNISTPAATPSAANFPTTGGTPAVDKSEPAKLADLPKSDKPEVELKTETKSEEPVKPVPAQTPLPAQTPKPAEAATATPTK